MGLDKPLSNIILLGSASTGSKLLRDYLAQHPLIDKIPYDVSYIWRIGNEDVSHDELDEQLLSTNIRNRIIKHLNRFHQGVPFLLDKTNANSLRVPFVHAVFPEAFFIHLIRDPLDVVQSAHRRWSERPDLRYILRKAMTYPLLDAFGYAIKYAKSTIRNIVSDRASSWGQVYAGMNEDLKTKDLLEICAIQYVITVESAVESLKKINKEKVFTIHYEDFVSKPLENLKRMALFLGIDPNAYIDVDMSNITTKNIGKGARSLSNEEKAIIQPIIERIKGIC